MAAAAHGNASRDGSTAHPLRPLAMAVSPGLSNPRDLLRDLHAIRPSLDGHAEGFVGRAHRTAVALATAALLFSEAGGPERAAAMPGFPETAQAAATGLATVASDEWPFEDDGTALLRRACLDIALGCLVLAGGRTPRSPDFLASVMEAMPSGTRQPCWTFAALPRYADAAAEGSPRVH